MCRDDPLDMSRNLRVGSMNIILHSKVKRKRVRFSLIKPQRKLMPATLHRAI